MSDEKKQHLEFIQNIITRMNTNSFQIKEFAVLILTAMLAVYAAEKIQIMLLIPALPTLILWGLDAYYLQQERIFRAIYDDVTELKKVNEVRLYEMPVHKYTSDKDKSFGFRNVFKSTTLVWFYLPLMAVPSVFFLIVYLIK